MTPETPQNKEIQWLLSEKYSGVVCPEFEADCEQLRAGEPLGYVIGFVPFLGTKIWLDSHPLIPRPETEYWVEKTLSRIVDMRNRNTSGGRLRILDLCAGSGCIGIAVAHNVPGTAVDFVEIDRRHHPTILKNIIENRIAQDRVKILSSDLFKRVRGLYDVILANPPYIDPKLTNRVGREVLAHEPLLALFGGVGGLECIVRIIEDAPSFLSSHGILTIEHEPEQADIIHAYARRTGYTFIETLPDQYGILRTTSMARSAPPVAQ